MEMQSEVARILKTIEDHSVGQGFGSFLAQTKSEKLLLIIAALSCVLSVVLLFIEPLRAVGLVAGLVFLLTVISLSLVQAFSLVAAFRRPLSGYAEAAQARLNKRNEYICSLAAFSPEGLAKKGDGFISPLRKKGACLFSRGIEN